MEEAHVERCNRMMRELGSGMSDAVQTTHPDSSIAEEHIESYHRCLDSVARERLYLAFVEAPPLDSSKAFVLSNIANDVPNS